MTLSCPHILQEDGGGILTEAGDYLATETGCTEIIVNTLNYSPVVSKFAHSPYTRYRNRVFGWRNDYRNR